jgi:hypothetical protein|tara:strand:+ start:2575 stop:2886 length:312 start_codon:yes stop_codon:yes gene_type:complete
MEIGDWTLTTKGNQVECRKTFSGPAILRRWPNQKYNEHAQMLLIVSLDGWKAKNVSGKQQIRLSMNGAAVMEVSDILEINSVIIKALNLLKKERINWYQGRKN